MENRNEIEQYLRTKAPVWKNIWIIFATGIISFLSASFSNLLFKNNSEGWMIPIKIILGIVFFLTLYGLLYLFITGYRRSRYYRSHKISQEEICGYVNKELIKDLKKMLENCGNQNKIERSIVEQEYLYRIDGILEFIDRNVDERIIRYNSGQVPFGRSYERINPGMMKAVFNAIQDILNSVREKAEGETDKESNDYRLSMIKKNEELRSKLLRL